MEQIRRACDPEEILLFGSHAKGLARTDSDIDLLVIADFVQSPVLRRRTVEEAIAGSPVHVDVHLYRRDEIGDDLAFPGSVLSNAVLLFHREKGLAFSSVRT